MVFQPKKSHYSLMVQILKARHHHCSPSPSLCPQTIQENQNPNNCANKGPAMPNNPYFLSVFQLFFI